MTEIPCIARNCTIPTSPNSPFGICAGCWIDANIELIMQGKPKFTPPRSKIVQVQNMDIEDEDNPVRFHKRMESRLDSYENLRCKMGV